MLRANELKQNNIVVVGIGASAGGLEALQGFLKGITKNTQTTYIIAQHLSPTYKSMMVNLLQKDSPIVIEKAKNGTLVVPNVAYICPPNKNITITDDIIHLTEPNSAIYAPKPSVDLLFESIANCKGNKAIGVILSGTGSDGSRGIRAIKAAGGFTLAQEPESAKYDGMPISAINTGNIDLILPPEKIADELYEILQYPFRMVDSEDRFEQQDYKNIYKNILIKLQKETKVDFSLYKSSTMIRRIERRMATLKLTSVIDYHNHLQKNKEETIELFKDILIGVTSFFRDGDSFHTLKTKIREYLAVKNEKIFRVWTAGCSTGEEPYTIAMILSDILGPLIAEYKIQIFASDLDDRAINTARKGIYPESAVLDIPKNYKNKYFTVKGDQFEVIKPIKEMVIFSKHDITRAPPFLRLDLLTCRNLLIYFTAELQKKIFPTLHYALKPEGILMLGKSESVGQFQNYFQVIDKKWKIYKAIYLGRKESPPINTVFRAPRYRDPSEKVELIKSPSMSEILTTHIEKIILPSSVIVNEMMDIIFVKGDGKYLIRPQGDSTDNIFKNVHNALSIELRTLLNTAKVQKKLQKSKFQKISFSEDNTVFVRVWVIPVLEDINVPPLYIIFFQDEQFDHIQQINLEYVSGDDEKVKQVELELLKTREQLQAVIEEIETSNEEMQSMNEELQSSNEEFQSSNEELETTNEELQSTNEELQTAYSELRASYDEKEDQKNELERLQNKLRHTNELLDRSQQLSKTASWEWNLLSEKMFWTENHFRILDLDSEKFIPSYESFLGFIHSSDKVMYENAIEKTIVSHVDLDITFKIKTKLNTVKKIRSIAHVKLNKNNKAIKLLGTILEISDQQ